jgi:hypothetical protein
LYHHSKCLEPGPEFDKLGICDNPQYMDEICQAVPIQIVKLERVNLSVMSPLLTDPSVHNAKILLLIRDPRGIINARKKLDWCTEKSPDCSDPKKICADMVQDFIEARNLVRKENNNTNYIHHCFGDPR